MRRSRTHFEQIPLEVVKKIAEGVVFDDAKAETDTTSVEPVSKQREPHGVTARSLQRKRR
jgi:hypothetical protein